MRDGLEFSALDTEDATDPEKGGSKPTLGLKMSIVRQLKPGETLYCEGETATYCFEVLNGVLKEYQVLEDGRREISEFYRKDDLFGYCAVTERLETVEAVTSVAVRCIPRDAFFRRMEQSPAFSRSIVETLIERLARAHSRMLLLGRMRAHQRVASFLLRLADDAGDDECVIEMSRQDIADHLGLTIETVCRVLTDFKKRHLIDMPVARRFTVRDSRGLEAEADTLSSLN